MQKVCVYLECESNKIFERISGKCVCPKTAPHWDGETCVSCSGHWNQNVLKCIVCNDNQHWNESVQSCVACLAGEVYNEERNICVSVIPECYGGQQYNPLTGSCQCFENTPYFDGEKCLSCSKNSFWSSS